MISNFLAFTLSKLINFIEKLIFFPALSRAIVKIKDVRLIIDVGTNKGQSIEFFQKNFPEAKIIGFEPNEKLNKFLKKFESDKCRIINLGLSSQSGEQVFYENLLDETSSFSKPDSTSKWGKFKKILLLSTEKNLIKEQVKRVITLDDFCTQNGITSIDYLKIDVEGFELDVLMGAENLIKQGCIKNLQIENQTNDLHKTDFGTITTLLAKNKYKQIANISHGFGGIHDVIFTKQ